MSARTLRGGPGKPSLAVLGDLLLEIAVTSERPVERGTDVPGAVRLRRGGSAANTAAAFGRLGGRPVFIGSVGRDGVGRRLVASLREDGVTVHAVRADAPSARLVAIIERGGERSFVTERAAADLLRGADVRPGWLRGCGALHLPGYSLYNEPVSEAAQAAVVIARQAGALISVDLSSRAPLLSFGRHRAAKLLDSLAPDVLFATVSEGSVLARGESWEALLAVARTVVLKEGAEGCRVMWRGASEGVEQLAVATSPVAATDTTGAGDAFSAGFLYTLLAGGGRKAQPWSAALLRRAAVAGHRAAAELLSGPRRELTL
ncbi:MAG: hypothetical protein QOH61_860 [Chloroflexota bacterium]|nr:hypothetical protein [Chloroflexota bacterium]